VIADRVIADAGAGAGTTNAGAGHYEQKEKAFYILLYYAR